MLSHKAQRTRSLEVDRKLSLSHECSLGYKKVNGMHQEEHSQQAGGILLLC